MHAAKYAQIIQLYFLYVYMFCLVYNITDVISVFCVYSLVNC